MTLNPIDHKNVELLIIPKLLTTAILKTVKSLYFSNISIHGNKIWHSHAFARQLTLVYYARPFSTHTILHGKTAKATALKQQISTS